MKYHDITPSEKDQGAAILAAVALVRLCALHQEFSPENAIDSVREFLAADDARYDPPASGGSQKAAARIPASKGRGGRFEGW